MTLRIYFSEFTGTGTHANGFKPVFSTLLPPTVVKQVCDGRIDPKVIAGVALILADVTPAQHAIVIADNRITYLPFEDASNNPLSPNALLSAIPAGKRVTLRTHYEAQNIPISDFSGTTTITRVYRRAKCRFVVRRVLGADDLVPPLTDLVSTIPLAQRQRARINLLNAGITFDDIQGDWTKEQALIYLCDQTARILPQT
jgi:hypothetical protein